MIIFEAFDRPANYRWVTPSEIEFKVGNTEYRATYKETVRQGLSQIYIDFQWKAPDGMWSYKLKKGGNPRESMQVFSTVLVAGEEKIAKESPDFVTFSSFIDEDAADANKRFRIYEKMASRYASKIGYTLHVQGNHFYLKNNNPVQVKRLPNDGIKREDELTYVEIPRCNSFTWATLFECTNVGDFDLIQFKNGFATINYKTNTTVEIKVKAGGRTWDNLDTAEVWNALNGDLFVQNSWGDEPMPMSEKASLLDNGWMILSEGDTVFMVKSVEDFESVWGYKLDSIQ